MFVHCNPVIAGAFLLFLLLFYYHNTPEWEVGEKKTIYVKAQRIVQKTEVHENVKNKMHIRERAYAGVSL